MNLGVKSCQFSKRNVSFVEEKDSEKLEKGYERVIVNNNNIADAKEFLNELIEVVIDPTYLKISKNNVTYIVGEIADALRKLRKVVSSKIAVFILYLGFKLPLFYLNLIKKLMPEVHKQTISDTLKLLEKLRYIRKVGANEHLEQKYPFLVVISQNSRNPLNARRVKFYVLTERGEKLVKIFKNHIENMIEPYLPRIAEYQFIIRKTHKRLEMEAKRRELLSIYCFCRVCGLLIPQNEAIRRPGGVACPKCGKEAYFVEYFSCSTCRKRFSIGEAKKHNFMCPRCGEPLSISYKI